MSLTADEVPPPERGEAHGDLRQEAARIEQLLEDVRALATQPVQTRVDELVRRLVHLYGTGLRRLLGHLADLERLDGPLADRLAEDELLASLLTLHGLHPFPLLDRVQAALEGARGELERHIGPFVLVAVEGDLVRLRLEGSSAIGAAPVASAERLLGRILAEVAPEVSRIEVEGGRRPARAPDQVSLVQIDLRRGRSAPLAPEEG